MGEEGEGNLIFSSREEERSKGVTECQEGGEMKASLIN